MAKSKFEVGDIVVITDSNEQDPHEGFFHVGDLALIVEPTRGKFSGLNNPSVTGDGDWWIGVGHPTQGTLYAYRHATNQEIQERIARYPDGWKV